MRDIFLSLLTVAVLAAQPPGPKLSEDNWSIRADIECGNSRVIERIGADHFAVAPREDPVPIEVQKTGPISNYVVYVEVENLASKPREITLDVLIPEWLIRDKFDYFLRKAYLLRAPDNLEYYELAPDRQTSLPDKMRLRIPFAPRERKILATTPSYPYSMVRQRLENIERRSNGKARIKDIGRSLEGRPILSLEMGDKSKPRAVFTSTFQPGEPSAWAVLAMMEAVLFDAELTHFQQEYDLSFVPMTNPDGVVHGSNNVNSKGEIVLLGFSSEAQASAGNHEARILWDYLKPKPPVALIEFHFLVLPNHPLPRPYVFTPELYTDPEKRKVGMSLIRRLERLSGADEGKPIPINHKMWKHLVTYNAILNWNTAATLYQDTGPKVSYRQAERRGVEAMRVALDPEYMK
jgi:Zinc carboxypeptidase